MKCLALLLCDSIESDDARITLRGLVDGIGAEGFPAEHTIHVYTNLLLSREEEGLPVDLQLEILRSGQNETGRTLMRGDAIGPVREHPEMPSIWGVQFHKTFTLDGPGLYQLRLSSGDQVLAERPVLVSKM